MPVRTIGHDEAAARRPQGKRGTLGAPARARVVGRREATPQQGPPELSSQEEYPSLVRKMEHPITRGAIESTQPSPQGGSKRPLSNHPPRDRGTVVKPGGNGAGSGPISPQPMSTPTLGRRGFQEPPQQLCPAPGPMRSGALVIPGQTPKNGSREFESSLPGGRSKGKGKASGRPSQGRSDPQGALTPKAVPFFQEPQHALIGHSHHATSWLGITPGVDDTVRYQNQFVHLPFLDPMTSLPVTIAPRSVPDSGSLSLPNTSTADINGRDFAIYQNALLVAGAQKEHEENMGGIYGQDLSISSTNPDGHYVCGRVLEDLKVRNAELKEEFQAIRAKEEELKHENSVIKAHCSAMEATLLSIGPQRAISLGDFAKMMGEVPHLRATVNSYQQEIAVLRTRLLANGIDPSIIATPVVPAPQEPISALTASIQEAHASGSLVAVSNSVNSEQENGRFPSNKFFVGEFGIFFRSIANLGRCNYQFTRQMPVTTVQIPPQVREKLKVIVQGNEPLLDWLLDDANKTKFLLVSGLFARLIYSDIMVEAFVDQLILKMGEAPSEKHKILTGWVQSNPDITNKVWPILTEVSENLGAHLHNKYVSLLSRPTDARHLEESLRSLVGCIEHAGRLALGMAYLGWGNWRFMFHGTACAFQSAKMTVCDLGTEGLLNFGHDTSVLEERGAKIKFCVFPMVYRRDNTGAWRVLVKATALV